MSIVKKQLAKYRRAHRTRARLHGTAARPRLSVFRSAKHFSAQLINDDASKTIVSVHDKEAKDAGKPTEVAAALGGLMAKKAKEAGIDAVVFDRGSFAYHGRVQAFADAAREGGLTF